MIPAIHITHPESQQQQRQQHPPNGVHDAPNDTQNTNKKSLYPCGRYTLLYSHGNAEDLGLIAHFLTDLARLLGINVLCYDYAGYGQSVNPVYVSLFLREYGDELEVWKRRQRELGCGGGLCDGGTSWSDAVGGGGMQGGGDGALFVAPMVHPTNTVVTKPACEVSGLNEMTVLIKDEFDFVDDGTTCEDDNETCLSSCDGESSFVLDSGHEEEEEDGGYFVNTCGGHCNLYEDVIAGGEGGRQQPTQRSNLERMLSVNSTITSSSRTTATNKSGSINSPQRKKSLSPKTRRRKLLSRHSWTAPSPSEQQCYNDIQSAYTYLVHVKNVNPKNVLLYGKSVGSGPTSWLAQQLCTDDGSSYEAEGRQEKDCREGSGNAASVAPGGVILHSPFLSVIRVVLDVGFTTIGDLFPNVDRVQDFT